ncbi:MAG: acyl-protein synthetase [Promethearchaeota archaeon]
MKIDEFLDRGQSLFRTDPAELAQPLFEAVKETAVRQFQNCALYRQLCKSKDYDPRRDLKSPADYKDLPFVTTANFKGRAGRPKELLCVPEEEIVLWGLSSGTSGDPSMVGRDRVNLARARKAGALSLAETFEDGMFEWFLGFTPPLPPVDEDAGPVKMSNFMYQMNQLNTVPPDERVYALAPNPNPAQGGPFIPNVEAVVQALNSERFRTKIGWIVGSVPLIYRMLTGYEEQTGQTFSCGKGTKLATGGGWKTFKGEAVSKEEFRSKISHVLGIEPGDIKDGYAFCETDVIFNECKEHNMHIMPWGDVMARDFETLEPVEVGERGLCNVINPMAFSFAGVSVLQDDVIRIVAEDGCPCGRRGKYIEVLGRAEGAEGRGCGAQFAEMGGVE